MHRSRMKSPGTNDAIVSKKMERVNENSEGGIRAINHLRIYLKRVRFRRAAHYSHPTADAVIDDYQKKGLR